jgi:hypothetical protein
MSGPLEEFYAILDVLRALPGQGQTLGSCSGKSLWPKRGVYFFLEPGELRQGCQAPRVVRVGTHAVGKGAKSTLWGRLRAHRGLKNGGGNHRGSIFRLHVGAAILARDKSQLTTWGIDSSASALIQAGETDLERRVSAHLGTLSVLWVDVPDEPGPASARAFIERNAIALLSNRRRPFDHPSPSWLGRSSTRAAIRESGLWNLDFVDGTCDPAFLAYSRTPFQAWTAGSREPAAISC